MDLHSGLPKANVNNNINSSSPPSSDVLKKDKLIWSNYKTLLKDVTEVTKNTVNAFKFVGI